MEIVYTEVAKMDLAKWKRLKNKQILKKIEILILKIKQNPYSGIGKPELMRNNLKGYWSRRINKEHRIVYRVADNIIYINSLFGHYI